MKTRIIRHYLPLILIVIVFAFLFYQNRGKRDLNGIIAYSTGYISLVILSFSLIMGSLNLMLKVKNPVSSYLRRDISIVGGSLAVLHSVTGLFVHLRGKTWLYFLNDADKGYSIRLDNFGLANYTGLFSALIIILLIITSNDYSLKKLGPDRWKNLQRFSYPMFILILIHCYFYRIGNENHSVYYWFYLPLIVILLAFQTTGFLIKTREDHSDLK
jgi:methionine sulfoxide reductase heme-binding subunit